MSRRRCLPLLLVWAAACVLFGAREAQACSCGQRPTVLEEYEQADVIVVVRVVSVKRGPREAAPGTDAKADAKPGAAAEAARADYSTVVSIPSCRKAKVE